MKHQSRLAGSAFWKTGIWILLAIAVYGAQPWSKDSSQWTTHDAQRVLADSPWSQAASASFPMADAAEQPPPGPVPGAPQAGMAGSRGASDGNWDGGVGRIPSGGVPSIRVTIRWDSALPVRLALLRLQTAGEPGKSAYDPAQAEKDYIITIVGLVPSGQYRSAGQLQTRSSSTDSADSGPEDPEQMLEGLMAESRLMLRNRKPIRPEDVKLDPASGTLHLFFPRNEVIELRDKEVMFATRFGSMAIQKRFRLKDMSYKGKVEL
jgi:hypothetical protein